MCSRIVIAGERSGCGKTAVSLALMSALSRKGVAVQGFKTGPDYIDPSHYEARTGRKGRNIDLWMTTPDDALELFTRSRPSAGISVIEGVMGLYDGAYPDNSASTAHTAKFLGAPVILVLDAAHGSASVAASALGFKMFDPQVNIAGIVLNRVSSQSHAALTAKAVTDKTGVEVVGFLPKTEEISIGGRHLGLVHAAESAACPRTVSAEAEIAAKSLDIGRIEKIARSAPPLSLSGACAGSLFPESPKPQRVRLAVARDKAFSFYYEDALDLLSLWGCEITPFSPLSEDSLPRGTDAVFIGGGFPELYSEDLEGNVSMRDCLRRFALGDGAVYGECGGMMYLGKTIKDFDGRRFDMCSVLPADFEMRPGLQSLGYRDVRVKKDAGFFRSGDRGKGHEFHYSAITEDCSTPGFFEIRKSSGGRFDGGMSFQNTVASYVHLSFVSSGLAKLIPHRIKPEPEKAV